MSNLPTESECADMCARLELWLAMHKPRTEEQWARFGADYLSMQALQISVDFARLQAAYEEAQL